MEAVMKTITTVSVLMAVMFLFFASSAIAAWEELCDEPFCCEVTFLKGAFQFKLVGKDLQTSSECPEAGADWQECYKYEYEVISSDGSPAQSSILFTIPYAGLEDFGYKQVDMISDPDGPQGFDYALPAEGDPANNFAKYVQEIRVATIPFNNDVKYIFYSNTGTISRISVAIKSGKNFESCPIGGPDAYGHDPTQKFTFNSEETVTTSDGKKFKFTRDPDTNCVITAEKELEGGGWTPMAKVRLEDYLQTVGNDDIPPDQPIKFVGHQNQRCYESWVNSNPWAYVNGRWIYY